MITRVLENHWGRLGLRVLVGTVFVYAGVIKMVAPQPFADSIATFRLLPAQLINLLALGLPLFEISLGGLLLAGKLQRMASLGTLLLCGMFALAIASALVRGLPVDCGCFGSRGASVYQGWVSLGRDLLLSALTLTLYMKQGELRCARILDHGTKEISDNEHRDQKAIHP